MRDDETTPAEDAILLTAMQFAARRWSARLPPDLVAIAVDGLARVARGCGAMDSLCDACLAASDGDEQLAGERYDDLLAHVQAEISM